MNLQILNPLTYPGWDDLIAAHPQAGIFHTSSWARVLNQAYGFQPVYFTSIHEGRIAFLLPLMEVRSLLTGTRGVSLPFTDLCPPLVQDPSAFGAGLEGLLSHGRNARWKSVELRGGEWGETFPPSQTFFHHRLALSPDVARMRMRYQSRARWSSDKAAKAGVEVVRTRTSSAMEEFFRLNSITRRMHGLPPQPKGFFRSVQRHIVDSGRGDFFLASWQRRIICGALFFHFGDRVMWKYGASDPALKGMQANSFILDQAICRYGQDGFREMSFGRTDLDTPGVASFKASWGAVQETERYFKFDFRTNSFSTTCFRPAHWQKRLFEKMPIPILNAIGALFYRHVG